jgi:hypothetical protein
MLQKLAGGSDTLGGIQHAVDNSFGAQVEKTLSVRTKFRIISVGVSWGLISTLPALLGNRQLLTDGQPNGLRVLARIQQLLGGLIGQLVKASIGQNYLGEFIAKLVFN